MSVNSTQRTNNDDGGVFTTNGNICASLVTKAGDISTFCADDPWEHRAVRKREETDMRHMLGMFEGLLQELARFVQSFLILGFQGPNRVSLLGTLIVFDDLPLCGRGVRIRFAICVINTGCLLVRCLRRTRWGGWLFRLHRVVDLHVEIAESPEKSPLL